MLSAGQASEADPSGQPRGNVWIYSRGRARGKPLTRFFIFPGAGPRTNVGLLRNHFGDTTLERAIPMFSPGSAVSPPRRAAGLKLGCCTPCLPAAIVTGARSGA
jgi:hypothetical protein